MMSHRKEVADHLCIYRSLPENEFNALRAWAETFYVFQQDWLFDLTRASIGCKSRQIGWSHTTAANGCLWSGVLGEPTMLISIGKRESAEVLDKCARHARVLQHLGSDMLKMVSVSKTEIHFRSGGKIIALPGDGGRSFSGNVVLDEFGYAKRDAKLWDAAVAATSLSGYKLRILSTPNGMGNLYHSLWEKALRNKAWSTHEVPIQRAIEDGYKVDLDYAFNVVAQGDQRLFEQLYNCSFLDSVLQYLPTPRIEACRTRTPFEIEPNDPLVTYYAGLDIGRSANLTVLTVVAEKRGRIRPVHIEMKPRTDSDALDEMVAWAFDKYDLRRITVDRTGLGSFPSDRMKKRHGDLRERPHRRNRVEAIDFEMKIKEALVTSMHTRIFRNTIELPSTDADLPHFQRACFEGDGGSKVIEAGKLAHVNEPGIALLLRKELASIQRIVTASNNVIYDAPNTSEGHADRAWSLMLANYAVEQKSSMLQVLQGEVS